LYTSGTTGPPKGVVLSQRAKAIQYLASAAEFGIGAPSERSLTVGPLTHGATLGLAIATINAGGRVVALPLFHPEAIFRQVELHRITNFAVVPTHLKVLLEFGASDARELDTSSLRHIVVGGAALPLALKEQAIEFFGPGIVQENYGSSEIGVSSWLRPEDQLRKHGSVGQPFHSVTIRIVGEDGAEVPIGQVGSLQLKAPTAFDGYWRRPADTAAAFRDGFFVTRDLARLDEEGFIYLCDRIDDSINTGGLTVLPREIEDVLVRHPDVAQAVAFGVPDVHLGEAVRAAVVLRPGGERDVRGLLAFSAANLGREKRPKAIDIVAEIPTDATGKILRRRLRDPFWALE
ncbi:MAG TPA: AMP-binding protein, partial [Gaiellaceae bacterium]|nr:AMP-binding protein [Gaiellaceae bacterium]